MEQRFNILVSLLLSSILVLSVHSGTIIDSVVPKAVATCHKCESVVDGNCQTAVDISQFEPDSCQNDNELCYTYYDPSSQTIKRGCDEPVNSCEAPLCMACGDGDNCNNAKLELPPPVTCYKCTSGDGVYDKCREEQFDETDSIVCGIGEKCVITIDGNRNTVRGCQFDTSTCTDANIYEKNCEVCNFNLCNDRIFPSNRTQCHQCNGLNGDDACSHEQIDRSNFYVCDKYYEDDTCFLAIEEDGTTYRGCKHDDHERCLELEDDGHCVFDFMYEYDINDNTVHEKGHCYSCDSKDDPTCKNNYDESVECPHYLSYQPQCYVFHNKENDRFIRGCLQYATEVVKAACAAGDSKCIISGDAGNTQSEPLYCVVCDSIADPNCKSDPAQIPLSQCERDPSYGCYLKIEGGVYTRGCVTSLIDPDLTICDQNGDTCKICDGDGCNAQAEFLQCLVCESETGESCIEGRETVEKNFCEAYNDQCYTVFKPDYSLARGCLSDFGNKCSTFSDCERCSDSNCNVVVREREPTYECVKCDEKDEKCAWGYSEDSIESCKTTFKWGEVEVCYTHTNTRREITRGCYLDDGDRCSTEKGELCETCTGSGCNRASSKSSKCVKCSSEENSECKSSAISIEAVECKGDTIFDYRGCYTLETNGVVERGCLIELDDETRIACKAGEAGCTACQNDGCNSSATTIQIFSVILFASVWLLIKTPLIDYN